MRSVAFTELAPLPVLPRCAARLPATVKAAAARTAATGPAAGIPPAVLVPAAATVAWWWWRWRWLAASWTVVRARCCSCSDLLVLRQGSPGPVPPDQRQAGLLQRLLPEPAWLIQTPSSARGPTYSPPSSDPRPGLSADLGSFHVRGGGQPRHDPQRPLDRLPASNPRSNLRSVPWSSRSMLSEGQPDEARPDRCIEDV